MIFITITFNIIIFRSTVADSKRNFTYNYPIYYVHVLLAWGKCSDPVITGALGLPVALVVELPSDIEYSDARMLQIKDTFSF